MRHLREMLSVAAAMSIAGVPSACTRGASFSPGITYYSYGGPDLGNCSGQNYVVIDVIDCAGCGTTTAYALCDRMSFSKCSCEPPSGWTEADAGTR